MPNGLNSKPCYFIFIKCLIFPKRPPRAANNGAALAFICFRKTDGSLHRHLCGVIWEHSGNGHGKRLMNMKRNPKLYFRSSTHNHYYYYYYNCCYWTDILTGGALHQHCNGQGSRPVHFSPLSLLLKKRS